MALLIDVFFRKEVKKWASHYHIPNLSIDGLLIC